MICSGCGKQKDTLHRINSRLIQGMKIVVCTTCESNKIEPRYIVILAYNQYPQSEAVLKAIKEQRYYGDPIALKEVIA